MSAPGNQPQSPTSGDRDGRREQSGRDTFALAQDRIATAMTAVREAGAAFRHATQPTYTSSVGVPIAVQLSGMAARTEPVAGMDRIDPSAVVSAFETALAYIGEYGAVRAGTLTVNGQSIEIEPEVMTLRDVVAALNHLADVSASLDETSGRVNISSRRPSSPLAISDASHVLDAVGISAGSYMPAVTVPALVKPQTGATTPASTEQLTRDASAVVHALNRDLAELATSRGKAANGHTVADALETAASDLRREGITGLRVHGDGAGARLVLDQEEFVQSLTTGRASGNDMDGRAHAHSSGFEFATRLRSEMSELLNGAQARARAHAGDGAAGAARPATESAVQGLPAVPAVPGGFATQTSPGTEEPGRTDRDDPLQRGLLPLDDDELTTF